MRGGQLVMLAVLMGSWGVARWIMLAESGDGPRVSPIAHMSPMPVEFRKARVGAPVARVGPARQTAMSRASPAGRLALVSPASAPEQADIAIAPPTALASQPVPEAYEPAAPADIGLWALAGGSASPDSPARGRLSGDGWLLLRSVAGVGSGAAHGGLARYGASQIGSVMRYRVSGSTRPLNVYLRSSSALGADEADVATGFDLRLLRSLPARLFVEMRLSRSGATSLISPGWGMVVSLPEQRLAGGWKANAYASTGRLIGQETMSYADLQLRLDRPILVSGSEDARFRGGIGLWAAGQTGAARLDIGPQISRTTPSGPGYLRIEADWRWRIGGNALPGSGPALAIGAGF